MANEAGFITKIETGNTKFGERWYVHVNGQRLLIGKFQPKGLAEGDYVTYETEQNGQYTNLKNGTMQKAAPPAGAEKPTPPKPSSIKTDRQDVISRQAALNSAQAFLTFLASQEALPVTKAKSKDPDMYEAMLMEYTAKFYHINTLSEYEIPDEIVQSAAESWDEQE